MDPDEETLFYTPRSGDHGKEEASLLGEEGSGGVGEDDASDSLRHSQTRTHVGIDLFIIVSASRIPQIAFFLIVTTLICSLCSFFWNEGMSVLPHLSETGIVVPGKYIFTSGLIFATPFLLVTILLLHVRMKQTIIRHGSPYFWTQGYIRIAAVIFGLLSCIFLILLAVVTLTDEFIWHQFYAFLFFMCGMIQAVCVLLIQTRDLHVRSPFWIQWKRGWIGAFLVIFLVIPSIMASLLNICPEGEGSEDGDSNCVSHNTYASLHALTQYGSIAALLAQLWSYRIDIMPLALSLGEEGKP
eukprot:TRINITY_DN254_c0_g1_i2.p1 TRINITY_DN254_c0_g1~~TRINITY_DN254_c0_g1_i2.p1  ORF type:complete len:322 (+),score=64.63 TRINITY_DN254_c0_g1_i2:71-967(+)